MIIKSMSRKSSTFGQLVEYCESGANKGDSQYSYYHNMHPGQGAQVVRDFELNAEYLPERKNGVYLYHEILSLSRAQGISNEQQKEILRETVAEYLSQRAPECMAYSVVHDEKDNNLHAHIIISSNGVDSNKRHRLEQYQYKQARVHAEKFVNENYPEMEQGINIDKYAPEKPKQAEAELKRRGGRTTQKDKLHADLQVIFASVQSEAELDRALELKGLGKSYRKGNINSEPRFGKADSVKHFRLKTLGLDTAYSQLINTFDTPQPEAIEPQKSTGGKSKADAIKAEYAEKVRKGSISAEEAKKQARVKTKKPQTKAKEYPWQVDTEKREKEAQKPDLRKRTEKARKEWISGDFTERDKEVQRAKYKRQNTADEKVKTRKEQSFTENRVEDVKEWFGGDFSNREARARKSKFDKLKEDSKTVKEKSEQTTKERFKENFNEFAKGDFSARDARSFKEKGEDKKAKNADIRKDAEKEAREAWFEEDKTQEFVDNKVQDWKEAEIQRRLDKVQRARDANTESPNPDNSPERD